MMLSCSHLVSFMCRMSSVTAPDSFTVCACRFPVSMGMAVSAVTSAFFSICFGSSLFIAFSDFGTDFFLVSPIPPNFPAMTQFRSNGIRIPIIVPHSFSYGILFLQKALPRFVIISHSCCSPLSRCKYSGISLPDTLSCSFSCTVRISSLPRLSSLAYPALRILCPFSCNSR